MTIQEQPMAVHETYGQSPTLGLVLGGGGGKGGAHLGVLNVLETLGIPVDMMVGTSIGGVVATLYAAGYSINEIAHTFAATSIWRLMERDPLGLGMLGLRRFRTSLEDMLGDTRFEDLRIPCAVVAADLVTGREVVIDSGPIVDTLVGAVALPGIFPPLHRDDMVLADAGVVNNLPVDVAYRRGAKKVIAVDLGAACDDFQVTGTSAGPRNLLNFLPNMQMAIANRGLGLLIAHLTRFQLAANPPDVLICPQVDHIGMLEFVRVAEGQNAGEVAAEAALDELLKVRDWRLAGTLDYLAYQANDSQRAMGETMSRAA